MKLNSITCIGYRQTVEGFAAVLVRTTKEDILAINPLVLQIIADNDSVVEEYRGFGRPSRLTENLSTGQWEVFFPNEDPTGQRVSQLESDKAALSLQGKTLVAQHQADTETNNMLQAAILELADVVFA